MRSGTLYESEERGVIDGQGDRSYVIYGNYANGLHRVAFKLTMEPDAVVSTARFASEPATQKPQPASTIANAETPAESFDKGMLQIGAGNYASALLSLQAACAGGRAEGCRSAASIYTNNQAGVRDLPGAFRLYQKGCELQDFTSCVELGLAYEHGRGTSPNREAAKDLYRQLCEQGDAEGCRRLKLLPAFLDDR